MKKQGRPEEIKDGVVVSIKISKSQKAAIERAARAQSNIEGRLINFSEMGRRGWRECFPVNKTLDMFKD